MSAAKKPIDQNLQPRRDFAYFLFYCIYVFLNFFVIIGEYTQRAIFFPIRYAQILLGKIHIRQIVHKTYVKNEKKITLPKKTKKKSTFIPKIFSYASAILKRFSLILTGLLSAFTGLIKRFLRLLHKASRQLVRIFLNVVIAVFFVIRKFFRILYSGIHGFCENFFTIKIRFFILGFAVCLSIISVIQMKQFIQDLPSPREIGQVNYSLSSHIYDRNGKLLYEVYHDQNRTPVKLNDLPTYIAQASIAIEDKDFYRHNGISLFSGVLRAARETFLNKNLQGGSTITQQLVKSALLSQERTVERKIKEIFLALWTERIYSKEQILEMYLNQVPYGGSAYGIEEASKTYFGKSAKDLTLPEAALLAGLPQAPSVYSPFVNPQFAQARRNDVLMHMQQQGYISKKTMFQAQEAPLDVIPPQTVIKAPHFVFYVKSNLEKEYGIREVEEGGLNVTTTLDLGLQQESEKILKEELANIQNLQVSNGGILITKPSTGEILAMVGSGDYFAQPSGAFNVTTALRQPGSSIKPIMYSLALQKGYTASTLIDDSPTTFKISDTELYKPVNYDGKYHGRIPLRYALANSFNIPAVKVLSTIGVDNFVDQAKKMGITTWKDPSQYGLSLTLGGGEVRMVDMAEAFGVFANMGYKVDITDTLKLEDSKTGSTLTPTPQKAKVLNEGIAYIISDILSDNNARQMAFGPNSQLEIPGYKVAVKTGTTDNKKDNWTIGYTPDYLVVVWVGNNDGTPMNPYLTSGVTGAAPIWHRVMEYLLKNYTTDHSKWFTQPDDVISKPCYYGRSEYFLTGTENASQCNSFGRPSTTPQPSQTEIQPLLQQFILPTSLPLVPKKDNRYNNIKQIRQ